MNELLILNGLKRPRRGEWWKDTQKQECDAESRKEGESRSIQRNSIGVILFTLRGPFPLRYWSVSAI